MVTICHIFHHHADWQCSLLLTQDDRQNKQVIICESHNLKNLQILQEKQAWPSLPKYKPTIKLEEKEYKYKQHFISPDLSSLSTTFHKNRFFCTKWKVNCFLFLLLKEHTHTWTTDWNQVCRDQTGVYMFISIVCWKELITHSITVKCFPLLIISYKYFTLKLITTENSTKIRSQIKNR